MDNQRLSYQDSPIPPNNFDRYTATLTADWLKIDYNDVVVAIEKLRDPESLLDRDRKILTAYDALLKQQNGSSGRKFSRLLNFVIEQRSQKKADLGFRLIVQDRTDRSVLVRPIF
jgi:hypothetical protein